jgi:hypothetical protein
VAFPPTTIPTIVPTPEASLHMPCDKIGQISVETSLGPIQNWLDYCSPAFSDKPGGETIDRSMPSFQEFEIGNVTHNHS